MEFTCHPSVAELARTAVAQATNALWCCPSSADPALRDVRVDLDATEDGRPELDIADGSTLARHLAGCPVATLVVPVRSPFRLLHLTGALRPTVGGVGDGARPYRMTLLSLHLEGVEPVALPLVDYAKAAADPFWQVSSAVVRHLEEAHGDDLVACVRAHGLPDVLAVVPRVLDRYGLELALVDPTGVMVVRLPFPEGPVGSFGEMSGSLHAILTCSCRGDCRHDD